MSNANQNDAGQGVDQLISLLNDNALDKIAGGYDPIKARGMAEQMFDQGSVEADGISKEIAIDRLAHAFEGIKVITPPKPAV